NEDRSPAEWAMGRFGSIGGSCYGNCSLMSYSRWRLSHLRCPRHNPNRCLHQHRRQPLRRQPQAPANRTTTGTWMEFAYTDRSRVTIRECQREQPPSVETAHIRSLNIDAGLARTTEEWRDGFDR